MPSLNPMLQSVLLHQNHLATTPYLPIRTVPLAAPIAAEQQPVEEQTEEDPEVDVELEEEEKENGEEHQ